MQKKSKEERVQKRLDYLRKQGIDEETLEFAKQFDEKYIVWAANQVHKIGPNLKNAETSLRHIIDWAKSERIDINNYDYQTANAEQIMWHQQLAKNADETGTYPKVDKIVYHLDKGFVVVEVRLENLAAEGQLMGHCVGGADYRERVRSGESIIYSLRDHNNKPHVTIEIRSGEVQQIYGKRDTFPIAKYRVMVDEFLNSIGHEKDPENMINEIGRYTTDEVMENILAIDPHYVETFDTAIDEGIKSDPKQASRALIKYISPVINNPFDEDTCLRVAFSSYAAQRLPEPWQQKCLSDMKQIIRSIVPVYIQLLQDTSPNSAAESELAYFFEHIEWIDSDDKVIFDLFGADFFDALEQYNEREYQEYKKRMSKIPGYDTFVEDMQALWDEDNEDDEEEIDLEELWDEDNEDDEEEIDLEELLSEDDELTASAVGFRSFTS